jgi:hypothetical protein
LTTVRQRKSDSVKILLNFVAVLKSSYSLKSVEPPDFADADEGAPISQIMGGYLLLLNFSG